MQTPRCFPSAATRCHLAKGPAWRFTCRRPRGCSLAGSPPAEPHTPPAPSTGWSGRAATDAVPPPQRCGAGAPGSLPGGRQPPPLHIWHFARWSLVLHTRAHACNRHASPPAPLPAAHPLLSSSIFTAATARRPRQGAIVALLRRLIKATVRAGTP